MSKIKIAIRKPQYLAAKESTVKVSKVSKESRREDTPFFFRLLLVGTYVFSALAIWYVYQKYSARL